MKIQLGPNSIAVVYWKHENYYREGAVAVLETYSGELHVSDYAGKYWFPAGAQYCHKTARRQSLTKALRGFPRETRRAIWLGLMEKRVKFF